LHDGGSGRPPRRHPIPPARQSPPLKFQRRIRLSRSPLRSCRFQFPRAALSAGRITGCLVLLVFEAVWAGSTCRQRGFLELFLVERRRIKRGVRAPAWLVVSSGASAIAHHIGGKDSGKLALFGHWRAGADLRAAMTGRQRGSRDATMGFVSDVAARLV
jgi:hypothetical protein